MPEYKTGYQVSQDDCDSWLGCGYPQFRVKLRQGERNYWVEAPAPTLVSPSEVNLKVVSVKSDGELYNVTMEVSGPNRVFLFMSPVKGVEVDGWGFSSEVAKGEDWKEGRASYGVQFLQGLQLRPQRFWITVSGWREGEPLMEASVAGHYQHGQVSLVIFGQWYTEYVFVGKNWYWQKQVY